MQYTQAFYIEDKFYGRHPREMRSIEERFVEPESLLFYCSKCGETFARFPVFRRDNSMVEFQAIRSCCRRCSSSILFFCPGSTWISWDIELQEALPREILRQELIYHLNQIEVLSHG